jgi:hypothetical protein
MPDPKFGEDDRGRVIAAVEDHYRVTLKPIGSRRKYLRDENGRRYLVLGGYEHWHGIPCSIFDAEERDPGDTLLVIAKRYRDDIDIYAGPFNPLLKNKSRLPTTVNDQYVFNLRPVTRGFVIKEVPSLALTQIGETKPKRDEKAGDRRFRKAVEMLDQLSHEERAELLRRLRELK